MKIFLGVTGGLTRHSGWWLADSELRGHWPCASVFVCQARLSWRVAQILGLIHVVLAQPASGTVFLLSSVLMCLAFCRASGPLGKLSSGGRSIGLRSWLCHVSLIPLALSFSCLCYDVDDTPTLVMHVVLAQGPVHLGCSAIILLAILASRETCLLLRPWFVVWLAGYSSADSGRSCRSGTFRWSPEARDESCLGQLCSVGLSAFCKSHLSGLMEGVYAKNAEEILFNLFSNLSFQ